MNEQVLRFHVRTYQKRIEYVDGHPVISFRKADDPIVEYHVINVIHVMSYIWDDAVQSSRIKGCEGLRALF